MQLIVERQADRAVRRRKHAGEPAIRHLARRQQLPAFETLSGTRGRTNRGWVGRTGARSARSRCRRSRDGLRQQPFRLRSSRPQRLAAVATSRNFRRLLCGRAVIDVERRGVEVEVVDVVAVGHVARRMRVGVQVSSALSRGLCSAVGSSSRYFNSYAPRAGEQHGRNVRRRSGRRGGSSSDRPPSSRAKLAGRRCRNRSPSPTTRSLADLETSLNVPDTTGASPPRPEAGPRRGEKLSGERSSRTLHSPSAPPKRFRGISRRRAALAGALALNLGWLSRYAGVARRRRRPGDAPFATPRFSPPSATLERGEGRQLCVSFDVLRGQGASRIDSTASLAQSRCSIAISARVLEVLLSSAEYCASKRLQAACWRR